MSLRCGVGLKIVIYITCFLHLIVSDPCVELEGSDYQDHVKLICKLNPRCSWYDVTTLYPHRVQIYENDDLLAWASTEKSYKVTRTGREVVEEVFKNGQWNYKLFFGIALARNEDTNLVYTCIIKGTTSTGKQFSVVGRYSFEEEEDTETTTRSTSTTTVQAFRRSTKYYPRTTQHYDSRTTTKKSEVVTKQQWTTQANKNIGSSKLEPEMRPCLSLKAGQQETNSPSPSDQFTFNCRVNKCNSTDKWSLISIRLIKLNGDIQIALANIERPRGVVEALTSQNSFQNFKVSGTVRDGVNSFLRVDWKLSDATDFGLYQCLVTYRDSQGKTNTLKENIEFKSSTSFVGDLINSIRKK
ncbi:hypothetical protein BgiMline_026518 [Biomphalaria glabrata]|nr:hypothetical protein BgiMline_020997 [Biomphalaria glabrata]